MIIGIQGELTRFEELKQTLPPTAEIIYDEKFLPGNLSHYDFIFGLNYDDNFFMPYLSMEPGAETIIILSSASVELKSIASAIPLTNRVFGMNCLPSFMDRAVKEVSYHNANQLEMIPLIEQKLNWKITPVKDRVGMVTPRILFMIINEAWYTLQEGTASKADIDTGMKLGTNYPFGPFEWCEKIGAQKVVSMLQKIYEDTRDERYKVCPLLKSEAYEVDAEDDVYWE